MFLFRQKFALLRTALLGCASLVAAFSFGQTPAQPVPIARVKHQFQGTGFYAGAAYLEVSGARGPVVGDFELNTDNDSFVGRVNVPAGATFRIPLPPIESETSPIGTLNSNRGQLPLYVNVNSAGSKVGVIGDVPGAFEFLSIKERNKRLPILVGDCPPEEAPTDFTSYFGIDSIVLGEGSVRMSQESIEAIKLYVIRGGQLVLLGGTQSWWATDPRMKSLVGNVTLTNRAQPNEIFPDLPKTSSLTYTDATSPRIAALATYSGRTIGSIQSYGVGRVVYLSFDPSAAPLNTSTARSAVLSGLFQFTQRSDRYSNQYSNQVVSKEDIRFLPTQTLLFWLIGYIAIVVPINLLILKYRKKQELAWVTAPIISVLAAAFFYSPAQQFAHLRNKTTTIGTLIVQQSNPVGVFSGSSEMFVAKAGTFRVGLNSPGSVSTSVNRGVRLKPLRMTATNGGIERSIDATNLNFRSFYVNQSVDCSKLVRIEFPKPMTMRITNISSSPILSLRVGKGAKPRLEPGEIWDASWSTPGDFANHPTINPARNAYVDFSVENLPVGVQIGETKTSVGVTVVTDQPLTPPIAENTEFVEKRDPVLGVSP